MKMFQMAWEWIVGMFRFLGRGSLWLALVGIAIVAGCAGPDGSINSPHGYVLDMDVGPLGFKLDGVPSILQESESPLHSEYGADGSVKEMPSTYAVEPNGSIKATGVAATWLARAAYCRIATCD